MNVEKVTQPVPQKTSALRKRGAGDHEPVSTETDDAVVSIGQEGRSKEERGGKGYSSGLHGEELSGKDTESEALHPEVTERPTEPKTVIDVQV